MSYNRVESTRSQVAIVGGGIAGAWLAYRLAQRDVPTVLISADACSPPLSRAWAAGLMKQRVVDCTAVTAPDVFADSSTTQDPHYPATMVEHVREEFDELNRLVEYQPLGDFLHPRGPVPGIRLGAGDDVVGAVLARFEELGGTRLHGRVTDLVVDGDVCLGLRYEHDGRLGKILCAEVVLASGGFCGVFADGVGTNTGYLLGTYARHGGRLANLELFNRFALGDLDRRRPLYPFDLEGSRLLRAGEQATELTDALGAFAGDRCDLDVFAHYWTANLDVPHTAELSGGPVRLGPIKGFAMGGMATSRSGTALRNVHATGECGYGLSVDSVSGKPFASFLAMGAELADVVTRRLTGVTTIDFDAGNVAPPADTGLRHELRHRLDAFSDTRFSVAGADGFVRWCVRERARRRAHDVVDTESVDLLILAEAYARSASARRESRGFFYRPDFPATDSKWDNRITLARYDADDDRVHVTLVTTDAKISS